MAVLVREYVLLEFLSELRVVNKQDPHSWQGHSREDRVI